MSLPAARRSASAARTWASAASGPTRVIEGTSARMPTLASDLALRTAASAAPTAVSSAASPPAGTSSTVGQAARCTEPSWVHDQTSSVT